MARFRVVVFDYDGTLFDTRPAIVHCLARAFAAAGRAAPTVRAMTDTVGTGLSLLDTLIVLDRRLRGDRAALNDLATIYRRLYLAEAAPLLKPFAGAGDTLQQLHAAGTKCIITSNKGVAAIRQSLATSGLGSFVDRVFGDEPHLPKKPDPAIMTDHILPQCEGVSKEQILLVGDTETDIVFAKAAGMASCWASYGYGDAERCLRLAPDRIIGAITELPALVSDA
jgi:phosphoglycolate phosphatase